MTVSDGQTNTHTHTQAWIHRPHQQIAERPKKYIQTYGSIFINFRLSSFWILKREVVARSKRLELLSFIFVTFSLKPLLNSWKIAKNKSGEIRRILKFAKTNYREMVSFAKIIPRANNPREKGAKGVFWSIMASSIK